MMTNVRPIVAADGRYTPSETARILKISRATVYRAMKTGELGYAERGRRRITGKEIRKYYLTH